MRCKMFKYFRSKTRKVFGNWIRAIGGDWRAVFLSSAQCACLFNEHVKSCISCLQIHVPGTPNFISQLMWRLPDSAEFSPANCEAWEMVQRRIPFSVPESGNVNRQSWSRDRHGLDPSIGWVGSDMVGYGWVGSGWVRSGRVGWVGSGWVGLGRIFWRL